MNCWKTNWLAVAMVGMLANGCYTTTYSFERVPDASHRRTTMRRDGGSSPIESTWTQDQNELVGKLSWKKSCAIEEHTTVNTEQVKTVAADKKAYAALAVLGIGLTVAGAAVLASASDHPDRDVCTDGHCSNPREDTTEAGASITGVGLGTTLGAFLAASGKPVVTREKVNQKKQIRVVSRDTACGDPASLSGLRVSVSIPGAGRWDAEAEKDGTLRIPLPSSLELPSEGVDLSVVVEDVPPSASSLLSRGDRIGRVRVGASHKSQRANHQPTEQPPQRTRNPA